MKKKIAIILTALATVLVLAYTTRCTFCNGTGWKGNYKCVFCRGSGGS